MAQMPHQRHLVVAYHPPLWRGLSKSPFDNAMTFPFHAISSHGGTISPPATMYRLRNQYCTNLLAKFHLTLWWSQNIDKCCMSRESLRKMHPGQRENDKGRHAWEPRPTQWHDAYIDKVHIVKQVCLRCCKILRTTSKSRSVHLIYLFLILLRTQQSWR